MKLEPVMDKSRAFLPLYHQDETLEEGVGARVGWNVVGPHNGRLGNGHPGHGVDIRRRVGAQFGEIQVVVPLERREGRKR
jgi:hypothetical protein